MKKNLLIINSFFVLYFFNKYLLNRYQITTEEIRSLILFSLLIIFLLNFLKIAIYFYLKKIKINLFKLPTICLFSKLWKDNIFFVLQQF